MLDEANNLTKDSVHAVDDFKRIGDQIRRQCSECGFYCDHSFTDKTSQAFPYKNTGLVDASRNLASESNTTQTAPEIPLNIDIMKKCCLQEEKKFNRDASSEKLLVCNRCGNAAVISIPTSTTKLYMTSKLSGKKQERKSQSKLTNLDSNLHELKEERFIDKDLENKRLKKARGSADSIKKKLKTKKRSRSGNRLLAQTDQGLDQSGML